MKTLYAAAIKVVGGIAALFGFAQGVIVTVFILWLHREKTVGFPALLVTSVISGLIVFLLLRAGWRCMVWPFPRSTRGLAFPLAYLGFAGLAPFFAGHGSKAGGGSEWLVFVPFLAGVAIYLVCRHFTRRHDEPQQRRAGGQLTT